MPATGPTRPGFPRTRIALGAIVAALLAPPAAATEFGALAPFLSAPSGPVQAKSLDGAPLTISPEPGRVTLVHFFASWCEPCKDELPSLAAFAKARSDTIRFIGVNVAEPASRAKTFAARFDLPGAVALDEDKTITTAFHVRGLPATVVLSPDGRTALAAAGPLDWTSPKLAETLDGLAR
ncbi:TlpA disulfide reductase family protein [Methylopila sp. M107]|uniref:TlpA family protein disulfide reductase n=1 Tax=Methylopila sp. M107 TaxID=1101190 RepID=UPI000380B830|nr:TlpA disulfide reductase family protein [Methylopila sp. M107]